MKEQIEVIYGNSYNTEIKLNERLHPNKQARLAISLVERWGMVAGIPDGEDSSGRAKLRLSTPEELANRAVAAAHAVFNEIEKNGWFKELPDQETILDENRKARERDRKQTIADRETKS